MSAPTNRKNLSFGADPVPDSDSGPLSTHSSPLRNGDFECFPILQSPADFHDIRRNDWRREGNENLSFWEPSGRHPDPNPDLNPGSLLGGVRRLGGGLCSVSTV